MKIIADVFQNGTLEPSLGVLRNRIGCQLRDLTVLKRDINRNTESEICQDAEFWLLQCTGYELMLARSRP